MKNNIDNKYEDLDLDFFLNYPDEEVVTEEDYIKYLSDEIELTKPIIRWMAENDMDICDLNVSHITDMSYMFADINDFNQDISGWNVSNVETMEHMFHSCANFNQSLANWNVSKVKDMKFMFAYAERFNGDITGWNVSNVEDMSCMFAGCRRFNKQIGMWDVSSCINFSAMFDECDRFERYLGFWNLIDGAHFIRVDDTFLDEYNQKHKYKLDTARLFVQQYQNNKTDQNQYKLIRYFRELIHHKPNAYRKIKSELKRNFSKNI